MRKPGMNERFISFEELAGMTDRELRDAALDGSANHQQFFFILVYLKKERAAAQARLGLA